MPTEPSVLTNPHRYRLRRAGVLNVWQYDEQVFDVEGGRLLLRGTNGAGKSKTLEMLLPFAIDGDKARMTASGRHHTSLLWLMLDGYDDTASRTGYVWVEFERTREDGSAEHLTCGVGLRASSTARQVTAWHFVTRRRVGLDLDLEDDAGPMTRPRLQAELEGSGTVYESAPRYKDHVGRELFGLDPVRYDELLRLLYWLRQPQVGEDIDPARLANQLVQALPQVDDSTMRAAGDTFDELEAFGEQIDRKDRSATAVENFTDLYGRYARGRVRELASALLEAHAERRRRTAEVRRISGELESATASLEETDAETQRNQAETTRTRGRLEQLRAGPEAQNERRLLELAQLVTDRRRVAERAAEVATAAGERVERGRSACSAMASRLSKKLATERERWSQTATLMTRSGWSRGAVVGEAGTVTGRESAQSALGVMASVEAVVDGERSALGALRAAVEVVDQARREHEAERAEAERAGDVAAEADRRLDAAIEREEQGRRAADDLATQLSSDLRAWAADAPGFEVVVPQPAADELATLPGFARRVSAPARAEWSEHLAGRLARLRALTTERLDLESQRQLVAAQVDPLPPSPSWARDSRERLAGAPLWRLVDFTPGTPPDVRAAVEAALEASGLLDAWVRPDGAVLDPDRHDVVLAAGAPSPGPSVDAVLTPDQPPAGSEVSRDVVAALLTRIGWQGATETAVASDGRWWLGGLHGRAAKATAQYIGAGARKAERARRLAEIEHRLALVAAETKQVDAARVEAAAAVQAIDAWVDAVPGHAALLEAWARLDLLEGVTREARERQVDDQLLAEQARARAAATRDALRRLADTHDLPADADGLNTRRAALSDVEQALAERVRVADGLISDLRRWLDDDERTAADELELVRRQEQLGGAESERDEAAARLDEAERVMGADVAELRRRISVLEDGLRQLRSAADELGRLHDEQVQERGGLRSRLDSAEERVADTHAPLAEAARAFASGTLVPGVLEAVLGPEFDQSRRRDVSMATADLDGTVPTVCREAMAEARSLATVGAQGSSVNELLAGWRDLEAGAGADVEPRLVEREGVYLVTGRDDRGEHPLSLLAPRLRADVESDKGLLSERERRLFEEHLLGNLGHALRDRRREADDLVRAMNQLLEGVSTSQGIVCGFSGSCATTSLPTRDARSSCSANGWRHCFPTKGVTCVTPCTA